LGFLQILILDQLLDLDDRLLSLSRAGLATQGDNNQGIAKKRTETDYPDPPTPSHGGVLAVNQTTQESLGKLYVSHSSVTMQSHYTAARE
jgi:hypothetical protein